jgi:PAS domain S-box-containing protein
MPGKEETMASGTHGGTGQDLVVPSIPGELRKSGLGLLGEVPWGTHFCQFYRTKEDLLDILVPYFRAGLENNEYCMWVTSDPLGVHEAENALAKAVPNFPSRKQKKQIEIMPYTDWYAKDGCPDSERVLSGWVSRLDQALAKGFKGLRLTLNAFWLEKNCWNAFRRYAEEVDRVIANYRMIALCTYCLDRCGAEEILDVAANHRYALIKRWNGWELIRSAEPRRIEAAWSESEERFRHLFDQMTEGFALHEILRDPAGNPIDYRFLSMNPAFERLTRLRREDVIGRTVREAIPGIEPAWIERFDRVAMTGEPDRFDQHSAALDRWFEVNAFRTSKGYFAALLTDSTERHVREKELGRLNRTLKAMSDGNQAMMRADTEPQYLNEVCRIIVEDCGHAMVWIGMAENDAEKSVRPVASAGFEKGYLEQLKITWADTERGRGPTGTAIRTGKWAACRNMLTDPKFAPWREAALKRGYASSVVFPFRVSDGAVGAINIYSREPDSFTDEEIGLLKELAEDVSYGIGAIRLREELGRQREWLRVTLTSIGDAVLSTDVAGVVAFLNPAASSLLGVGPEEAIGRRHGEIFRIMDDRTGGPAPDLFDQVLEEKRVIEMGNHIVLVRRDGTEVPIEDSASPILDAAGNITGVVLVFHDVTEKRRTQDALSNTVDKLNELTRTLESRVRERTAALDRMVLQLEEEARERRHAEKELKSTNRALLQRTVQLRRLASDLTLAEQRERQRLAVMLHDHLQQLLAAAKYRGSILVQGAGPNTRADLVELDKLLADCLDASRTLTAELGPRFLREADMEDTLRWLGRWMGDKHGLEVALETAGGPFLLQEDVKVLVFQSVRELLFNVVKHAQVKSARLAMGCDDDLLEVAVSDDGVGFDPTRAKDGNATGFGLFSIGERLTLMGGELKVESSPGKGSRVALRVPMLPEALTAAGCVDSSPAAQPGLQEDGLRGVKIKILLADDHKIMRQGLLKVLGMEEDIEVVGEAADGQAAVELARALRPNIVIMDVNMPRMNGVDATVQIKKEFPRTMVIGLSMFEQEERAAALQAAGADAYVTKTSPIETLLTAIRVCSASQKPRP